MEKKPKFKIGDRVRIKTKISRPDESPNWISGMDQYKGKVFVIADVWGDTHCELVGAGIYTYDLRWLEPVKKDVSDVGSYEVGDILESQTTGGRRRVLGVVGECVLLSLLMNHKGFGEMRTVADIAERGYKFADQPETEETVEVTLDEIAKTMGIDVKSLRIKDDEETN